MSKNSLSRLSNSYSLSNSCCLCQRALPFKQLLLVCLCGCVRVYVHRGATVTSSSSLCIFSELPKYSILYRKPCANLAQPSALLARQGARLTSNTSLPGGHQRCLLESNRCTAGSPSETVPATDTTNSSPHGRDDQESEDVAITARRTRFTHGVLYRTFHSCRMLHGHGPPRNSQHWKERGSMNRPQVQRLCFRCSPSVTTM